MRGGALKPAEDHGVPFHSSLAFLPTASLDAPTAPLSRLFSLICDLNFLVFYFDFIEE
jgi:hypothetical protein